MFEELDPPVPNAQDPKAEETRTPHFIVGGLVMQPSKNPKREGRFEKAPYRIYWHVDERLEERKLSAADATTMITSK